MENTNREGHKLLFKGEEYRLDQILSLAKSGPPIEVKLDELNLVGIIKLAQDAEEARLGCAMPEPDLPEYKEQLVVFYKQEGKYTVVLGREKVRQAYNNSQAVIKGKLLSGPALKRARIEVYVPEPPAPKVTPEPFNAPRFSDTRKPRYEDRGPRTDRTDAPRRGLSTSPRTASSNASDPRNQNIKRGNYTGGLYKKS